jgi:hypothetical protein
MALAEEAVLWPQFSSMDDRPDFSDDPLRDGLPPVIRHANLTASHAKQVRLKKPPSNGYCHPFTLQNLVIAGHVPRHMDGMPPGP